MVGKNYDLNFEIKLMTCFLKQEKILAQSEGNYSKVLALCMRKSDRRAQTLMKGKKFFSFGEKLFLVGISCQGKQTGSFLVKMAENLAREPSLP